MRRIIAFANRTEEVQLFLKMVRGDHFAQIFLVEADSGMGKSSLLKRFRRECPEQVHLVCLDLRRAEIGLPYLFCSVRDDIGYDYFTNFNQELQRLLSGSINFSNNHMEGDQTVQIALNVDEVTRKYRLSTLQDSFFSDLAALQQPIVILIDTFEEGVDELKNWIERELLRQATRILGLTVVIAGQTVPDSNSIVWGDYCEHHCLKEIYKDEDWYEYVKQAGLPFSEDTIRTIVCLFKGNPLEIQTAFDLLIQRNWR